MIVDSSPILPVADGLIIAQHVDAVLFSIFRDVSRKTKVSAALRAPPVPGRADPRGSRDGGSRRPVWERLRFGKLLSFAAGVGSRLIGTELIAMIRIAAAVVLIVGAGLVHGPLDQSLGSVSRAGRARRTV